MFSADRNAVLTVKIHSRPLTATQRAKWKENDYDVVLQVTNNTEHVLSLPKTLTSSSADVLCRSGHCWSVNDKQYHDQHSHQFNFNCSRKAIKIPPTGTLKVDKPCIIFSGIQRTKLRQKNTNTGTPHTMACSQSHWNTIYSPQHGNTEQFHGNAIVSLAPLIQSVYHGCDHPSHTRL